MTSSNINFNQKTIAQHLAAEMIVRLRPMNNREGVAAPTLA
jgi:hypothetical protein